MRSQQPFLMMTAHIKSGDSPGDVPAKKSQGAEVADFMADAQAEKMPVIFACDFNNRPGGDAHNAFFGQLKARNTHVMSAYAKIGGGKEPEFTTSKWRKGGVQVDKRGKTTQTIDYIFYTANHFECTRVLDMPPLDTIEPLLLMPGWKYPSDHFMICADLKFTGKPRRRMAQREHSNRRDSPVMTRLLQEIIDAQDN